MSIIDSEATTSVELSRAEQWVVHHVLLDALGLADGEPHDEIEAPGEVRRSLDVIAKLESGTFEFTPGELAFIRETCGVHARTTGATADRNLASSVADRVDVVLRNATT